MLMCQSVDWRGHVRQGLAPDEREICTILLAPVCLLQTDQLLFVRESNRHGVKPFRSAHG